MIWVFHGWQKALLFVVTSSIPLPQTWLTSQSFVRAQIILPNKDQLRCSRKLWSNVRYKESGTAWIFCHACRSCILSLGRFGVYDTLAMYYWYTYAFGSFDVNKNAGIDSTKTTRNLHLVCETPNHHCRFRRNRQSWVGRRFVLYPLLHARQFCGIKSCMQHPLQRLCTKQPKSQLIQEHMVLLCINNDKQLKINDVKQRYRHLPNSKDGNVLYPQ